eukprot:MONOS_7653.1-p1 / transcript=MONOS_7653.1 / gene=MONOS_7653 / organism=Monocercomonoides_exilis_PA203 / gene_product=unspecified product / transcript_product=unspecified product / location=Mono_scaffold00267:33198-33827(-) / protein_length=102 / sequence_SO=supercontig / SO=protein_coding / is_pseudo=false
MAFFRCIRKRLKERLLLGLDSISFTSDTFELRVRCRSGEMLQIAATPSTSIRAVKEQIAAQKGICVEGQQLESGGIRLEDEFSLADYNIANRSAVLMYGKVH